MNRRLRVLVGLAAFAAVAAVLLRTGGAADPAPPAAADEVRDVFLLLDRGPIHIRLKITIAGKSPQAVRRDYLARLFRALDTDKDGKLTRLEFDRSPLNTSRRGPGTRGAASRTPAHRLRRGGPESAWADPVRHLWRAAHKLDLQIAVALGPFEHLPDRAFHHVRSQHEVPGEITGLRLQVRKCGQGADVRGIARLAGGGESSA